MSEWLLLGYFTKRRTLFEEREIASISECIAKGPKGWIDRWEHNDAFLYDTPELARAAIGREDPAQYRIYAYRLLRRSFPDDHRYEPEISPQPIPDTFRVIGYDVASRSFACTFECSPLSCSGLAREVSVNAACLLDSLDDAIRLAERCGEEQPEPGTYFVVEVWRATP